MATTFRLLMLFLLASPTLFSQTILRNPSPNPQQTHSPGSSLSNLEVTPDVSPGMLIKRLFGNGCTISNVTVDGDSTAIGLFNSGTSSIGLDSGIVLSTGRLTSLPGPNIGFNGDELGFNLIDPDLNVLALGVMHDLIRIEFDLVAYDNQLKIDYVFGSEDYCQYIAQSNLNDVVGIFIKGPGYPVNTNIATVPNSNQPVNVTRINHLTNASLYVNNNNEGDCTNVPAYNLQDCSLNGWTVPLSATANVIPNQTYHIKIAIADVGDASYTSTIFLKANPAYDSPPAIVEALYPAGQTSLGEGCGNEGSILFERTGSDVSQPLDIEFTVGGSAIPGTDYMPVLTSPVTIPAGVTFVEIPIQALTDAVNEPLENIEIKLPNTGICAQGNFSIRDLPVLTAFMSNLTVPVGGSGVLSPLVAGGAPPYLYTWSTNENTASITVNQNGLYTVTVTDQCGQTAISAATVTVSFSGSTCGFPPPPGAESCELACIYCNLDGTQGINNGSPSGGNTVCGQISIHNDQWFGFVAGSTSITIDLITTNCQNGDGLQTAIFDNCSDLDALVCNPGCGGCGNETFSLTYSNYTPGESYWFLVDGYIGDVCDYEIVVTDGSTIAPPPDAVEAPQGPTAICAGGTAVYTVPDAYGAGLYNWTAPTGSSINGQSNNLIVEAPGGAQVTITFGNTSGPVCVRSGNACYPLSAPQCLNVTTTPIAPTIRPPLTICIEDVPFIWDEEPFPTLSAPGTYQLTSTAYEAQFGCDSIVQQTITINPLFITTLPPFNICAGECVEVAGELYCDPGPQSVVLESVSGCDSLVNFVINVLHPLAQILGPTQILCGQDSIVLSSAPTFGLKGWTGLSGLVLGSGNSLTVTQPGVYILTNTQGSGNTVCTQSDTVVVTSNPSVLDVQINSANNGCDVDSLLLSCVVSVNDAQFQWSGPNGFTATDQNILVVTPGIYTVSATNASGCAGTATLHVPLAGGAPDISAEGGTLTCLSNSIQLNGGSSTPGASFYWTGPNNFQSDQEDPSVSHSGDYVLIVTGPGGCTSSAIASVAPIEGFQITNIDIIHPSNGQHNGSIDITVSGAGPFTFEWKINGFPFANTEDISNLGPGVYTIMVTAANGCIVGYALELIYTGTHETADVSSWQIRPNPSTGLFMLCCNDSHQSATEFLVYDSSGRLTWQQAASEAQTEHTVDLSNAPVGVYFLEIRDPERSTWMKLVVQR